MYVIVNNSDVENLNSKPCVQVSAVEDKKDNDKVVVPDAMAVKQHETVSFKKEVYPEDKEKEEMCDLVDDTSKCPTGTHDDISLTKELCEESHTVSSISSENTYSTANQTYEGQNVKSPK